MLLWVINLQSKNHKRIGKQFSAARERRGIEARSWFNRGLSVAEYSVISNRESAA
jgi:hypothetical protein